MFRFKVQPKIYKHNPNRNRKHNFLHSSDFYFPYLVYVEVFPCVWLFAFFYLLSFYSALSSLFKALTFSLRTLFNLHLPLSSLLLFFHYMFYFSVDIQPKDRRLSCSMRWRHSIVLCQMPRRRSENKYIYWLLWRAFEVP